jgi:hypothetical protein
MIETFSVPAISPLAVAELFVAAVLSWICLNIYRTVRDPRTPPADGVMLDLGLGIAAVTATVFWLAGSLSILF